MSLAKSIVVPNTLEFQMNSNLLNSLWVSTRSSELSFLNEKAFYLFIMGNYTEYVNVLGEMYYHPLMTAYKAKLVLYAGDVCIILKHYYERASYFYSMAAGIKNCPVYVPANDVYFSSFMAYKAKRGELYSPLRFEYSY